MFRLRWTMVVVALAIAISAEAAVQTREFTYKQGDTELQGFFAWDDTAKRPRPGVLVVHEWWGLNQHARNQARRLAEAGYCGLALDMYGKGKVTEHPTEAQAFAAEASKDPALMAARFDAAKRMLMKDPHVDVERLAAIGYCFGGGVVLGRARAGDPDLDAVVTFHSPLATERPAQKGRVHARVLVLAGAADPFVPPAQVNAFKQEMKTAGARYEVISYPGAKHSFTNPDAGKYGMEQLAYNADADRKSWAAMLGLFKKIWP